MSLSERVANRLARYVLAHRRSTRRCGIATFCQTVLDGYHNKNYDSTTNGEFEVLRKLRKFPLRCFFDVGANEGEWTWAVKEMFPDAGVHAFEIDPSTAQRLTARVGSLPKVQVTPCGLHREPGDVRINAFDGYTELTTMIDYPHPFPRRTVVGRVLRGDNYVAEKQLEHIDFLKLDVEGAEHDVLYGLESTISHGKVDIVQFEYGQVNILTRFLLKDFYEFFRDLGYVVGKIYPHFVDFRAYCLEDEDFRGPNYLACRKEAEHYVAELSE